MRRQTLFATAVPFAILALHGTAIAQKRDAVPDNASRIADDLTACRTIADNAERLACFDRSSAAFAAARDRKDIIVVDRAEVRSARRSLFGFQLPHIRLFGRGSTDDTDEPEIREVTSKVTGVSPSGFQRMTITLEDGSRWQTTEGTSASPPRVGETIRITRASFSGYFIHLKGEVLVRARRTD